MDVRRSVWWSRVGLMGLLIACLAGLLWARPQERIVTDVLELIPRDERQPELVLVRSLAGEQRARVALFSLDGTASAEVRQAAAAAFVRTLKQSDAITDAVLMPDQVGRDQFGREVFLQRFNLLLPGWLAAHRQAYQAASPGVPWPQWLASEAARELSVFLSSPEALAFQDLVPRDPLLLIPNLITSVKGLENVPAAPGSPLLVWAMLRHPPLTEQGQQPVLAAVNRAFDAAKAIDPGLRLRWTSLARFAAASRQRIERELSTLNLASIGAVLFVAAVFLRQFWKAVNLIPVVLGAMLFAWTLTLIAFPHVHILVFVVGSLLTGVAIDYGFYLYLQPPATEHEPYPAKARRLMRPLLGSALTAILGFSLLGFSELPLIRQLGVFVSAGLLGAVLVSLLWFAQVKVPFIETRRLVRARPAATGSVRRAARLLLLAGAVVALVGPWRLHWLDNIRQLEIPTPGLEVEAREVRAEFGDRDNRAMYLTRGTTVAEARRSLDRFLAWHRQEYPQQPITSAAALLPTMKEWTQLAAARTELRDFPGLLATALDAAGFDAASFEPFQTAWNEWLAAPPPDYETTARNLAAMMHGPMSAFYSISREGVWFVSVADHRPDRDPPAGLGTASVSQLENLNRLFGRYRISAMHLSLLGLALVGLSVFLLYGLRHGLGIFAVPLGACFFAFGVFGMLGQTLNLLHLLGAFLGVCLSHNYSIFSAENELRREPQPPSIRLSAFATAASFGVLTFSHIPVVAALGSTVSLIVLSALAIVELKPLAGLTPAPHS